MASPSQNHLTRCARGCDPEILCSLFPELVLYDRPTLHYKLHVFEFSNI